MTETAAPQSFADRYAVFGNPIAQSRSPDIHTAFAGQTGQRVEYVKQLVEVEGFAQAADDFFQSGGKGLNITAPFKEDAFAYASELTERAQVAGAVNTLALRSDGTILGDNTDGVGMLRDITQRLGWPLRGRHVLLLGAGGAARGVVLPCLQEKPASLTIANRTAAKAATLAETFEHYCRDNGKQISKLNGCGFADLEPAQYDLVINATSAGLHGDLPPVSEALFAPGAAVYDMTYAATPTPFLAWAQAQGVENLSDGLGMLVGQAAESFYLWRGVRPDVQPVLERLRHALSQG